jgi:acyl-CoA synthetase (AMP-forming)/AMP-acid ligase II
MMNVAEIILERARSYPNSIALMEAELEVSFGQLDEISRAISDRLSEVLRQNGIEPRQGRVGLFWPNGIDYVFVALAILRAGACLVPIAEELTVSERFGLVQSTAVHLVISRDDLGFAPVGGVVETGALLWKWSALSFEAAFPEAFVVGLGPAFVRFSSGTTGDSKGVLLSHQSLFERVQSANRRLRITSEDRVLWMLPMAHHFAVSIVLYLLQGATTVIEKSHLAADILMTARRTSASVVYASPFHHSLLAAETSGEPWPSLRLAVSTAASLREDVAVLFRARFGVPLSQGLGIIEAGLPLLNECPLDKPLSVGRADDFEVRLVGENGEVLDGEGLGELQLRGPGFFDAYLVPWRERGEVMRDGWFSTGDIAFVDVEGFVFLRGRRKSVINFGGMKFFPEEVEEVLLRHPDVAACRVRGEEHERFGQIPVADVVWGNLAVPASPVALSKHCREFMASYKIPVRYRFVEAVPRTASGKIKR